MNLLSRFQGIIFKPKETFEQIVKKPVWSSPLILILVFLLIFSYIISPYAQKDQLQSMENNIKLKEKMGEKTYKRMIDGLKNPTPLKTLFATVFILIFQVIGILFSCLIILLLGRLGSSEGNFRSVLTAFLHASFTDKILGNVVRLFIILTRKTTLHLSTSLVLLFPKLDVNTPAYIILNQFDFFQLWMFGILAYGLSFIFKTDIKKALFISYGFWFLKSLLAVLFGLLSLQFTQ